MKHLLYLLCALLTSGMLFTGCVSRNAASLPAEHASSVAEASPETASEEDGSSDAPSEASSKASSVPEQKYPLPALPGVDQMLVEDNALEFVRYFGNPQEKTTADALDRSQMLAFCLSQINREKEMQGYFFDQNEEGAWLVPADLISEMAERMFGVTDFAPTDAGNYKKAQNCYAYKATDGYPDPDCTLSELRGTADGGIARDAAFTGGGAVRYSFALLRRNGMPYLRLIDITPLP